MERICKLKDKKLSDMNYDFIQAHCLLKKGAEEDYKNKTYWSSVFLNGNVPETILKQMLDVSYSLIFNSLSKKIQNEILNQ